MVIVDPEYGDYDEKTGEPKGKPVYYHIIMDRGDTASFRLSLKEPDDTPYTPVETDKVYFSAARSWGLKPVLMKQLTEMSDHRMLLQLYTQDTESLAIRQYQYDIEVIHNGYVYTVCKGRFTLGGEVNCTRWLPSETNSSSSSGSGSTSDSGSDSGSGSGSGSGSTTEQTTVITDNINISLYPSSGYQTYQLQKEPISGTDIKLYVSSYRSTNPGYVSTIQSGTSGSFVSNGSLGTVIGPISSSSGGVGSTQTTTFTAGTAKEFQHNDAWIVYSGSDIIRFKYNSTSSVGYVQIVKVSYTAKKLNSSDIK